MDHFFAAGFLLLAGPLLFAGNLLKNGDFSRGTRFWNANFAMEAKEKTLLLDLPDGNAPGKRLMNQAVDLKDRTWHRLSFRLQSEKAGIFRAVYQLRSAPYSILGLERNFAVTPGTQECSVLFRVTRGRGAEGTAAVQSDPSSRQDGSFGGPPGGACRGPRSLRRGAGRSVARLPRMETRTNAPGVPVSPEEWANRPERALPRTVQAEPFPDSSEETVFRGVLRAFAPDGVRGLVL